MALTHRRRHSYLLWWKRKYYQDNRIIPSSLKDTKRKKKIILWDISTSTWPPATSTRRFNSAFHPECSSSSSIGDEPRPGVGLMKVQPSGLGSRRPMIEPHCHTRSVFPSWPDSSFILKTWIKFTAVRDGITHLVSSLFLFGNGAIELNTKEETEIKEVTDSVSSPEKELPGCPGKNIKRQNWCEAQGQKGRKYREACC